MNVVRSSFCFSEEKKERPSNRIDINIVKFSPCFLDWYGTAFDIWSKVELVSHLWSI